MSMLTPEDRTGLVKEFASALALVGLPEIRPRRNLDSRRRGVDLAEGCFLTKSVKYTHQLAHWVNAVRDEYRAGSEIVS